MKSILLLLFSLGLATAAGAQDGPARGAVTGRITDAINGSALPGASVQVVGGTAGAATDLQGQYRLSLPAGSAQLNVRYLGYADTTFAVDVAPGQTQTLDIALSGAPVELSGVSITGQLQGQARALNQQRTADNIVNVVAADQIGRFPDPNAAEALQRVPGINIERDQGEGRYVLVRGLAPQFTNISVNGEQIPSPEADVRFVALDAIPADQLASMVVTKALTPDMDGDAIGGSVNLITRTAQAGAPQISGSILGGYNQLMQRPNVQGSLQYGQRFGTDERLGVLLNTSYYHNDLGSDNWEREPFDNELELRDYELTRTRLGLSSTFDYRFNPDHEVYFRTLYSRFSDREWRRRYVFVPDDGEIEKLTKDRYESQSVLTFNAGARHNFAGWFLNYEAQYSYAEQDTPYDNEVGFLAEVDHAVDFSDTEFPSFQADGYLDNTRYDFDELEVGSTLAEDRNLTGKFNVGVPYRLGGNEGLFQFGAKVRLKEKRFTIDQTVYEQFGGVPTLDAFAGGLLDGDFLDGQYELSEFAEMSEVIGYFNANPAQFEQQIEDKSIDEAVEAFDATENVYAAYAMFRQQLRRLTILGGVRYELTNVDYTSNDAVIAPDGDLQAILPVAGGTDYDFWLPQLHFRYALDRFTNLRFAATFSYARPNFAEIVPAQEANLQDREAVVGNPLLEPVGAFNLDLLGERYFGNVGVLSGGVFYKRLTNFIYPRNLFNSQYPLGAPVPVATGIRVTQAQNGEAADLLGFEAAFQRQLDFLPGALSGLGVYANYTYTQSEAEIQSRAADESNPDAVENIDLPGQAQHVGNFSLSYERRKLLLRLALNFNGEYLGEVGSTPEEDIFVKQRAQLDATASYTLTPRFRVFAEFLNLTNQPFETYQGSEDVVIQREFYDWWMRLGLKFDL